MAEESCSRVSLGESMATATTAAVASATRQRKKRKWDQPADILVSSGIVVPGIHATTNRESIGFTIPGVVPVSTGGVCLQNLFPPGGVAISKAFQVSTMHQHANVAIQKLIQPMIQDELIAREIVINEAESSIRYKLTKRQTQEEIQKRTGAVVITRGKYRPPGTLPDGEKPLYLHISSGAHLKEMAERIIAVDRAAAMVEEMLKPGHSSQSVSSNFQVIVDNVDKALSTCVYLGFDADPSANIAARIRGPNDQYINHIMNETGAAVLLRGRGAGNVEDPHSEEGQQPLHLYLSSNSPKCLEDAKRLAENLLDTISVEFGASRASSLKLYSVVPPGQHSLAEFQSSVHAFEVNTSPNACLTSPIVGPSPVSPLLSMPRVAPVPPSVGSFITGQSLPNYPSPSLSGGTSYNGYGGIYPQATPLQQVALALRHSSSPITSNTALETPLVSMMPRSSDVSVSEEEKGRPQRRKFQELPAAAKETTRQYQVLKSVKPGGSIMPPPKKLAPSSSGVGMPPPPPRSLPPPPPPPKFASPAPSPKIPEKNNVEILSNSETVPDTLIKLMEYGDDDDDDDYEETNEESWRNNPTSVAKAKPFWAL